MTIKHCELCGGEAAVYCGADSAFLCTGCDDRVHSANFLVARHVRQLVCPDCKSVSENHVSGSPPPRGLITGNEFCCKSCSSTSSLECISSCESSSTAARERGRKPIGSGKSWKTKKIISHGGAGGVFSAWCEKLGLNGSFKSSVVTSACWALSLCKERLSLILPFHVSLAASFWFGLRNSGGRPASTTWRNLKKVEEASGVPSRLIVAIESRVARALRSRNSAVKLEESSAESDGV